jgi:hypothetical protein
MDYLKIINNTIQYKRNFDLLTVVPKYFNSDTFSKELLVEEYHLLGCHCVMWKKSVGLQVLTVVVMKNTIFWDITLYSPLKVN